MRGSISAGLSAVIDMLPTIGREEQHNATEVQRVNTISDSRIGEIINQRPSSADQRPHIQTRKIMLTSTRAIIQSSKSSALMKEFCSRHSDGYQKLMDMFKDKKVR